MLERVTVGLLAVLIAICSPAAPVSADGLRTVDVRYDGGTVSLAALLMLPSGEKPLPATVIVHGSGASDRTIRWSQEIAEELVDHGLAVLLTDKRSAGKSGGDRSAASVSDLAGNVLAGVQFLARRSDIDARHIGVVGLNQRGQVVPIAAARSDRISFVISVSSQAVGFVEGSFIEMANTARQAGLAEPEVQEVV
jgi:pimeloyl-ACP methyl ester carboxylesterase